MGRKIPGKKHRGVKDPFAQHAKRFESLQMKINAPPTNPDEQQVPKSLLEIMSLTQKVKDGTIPTQRKKKGKNRRKPGPVTSEPKRKKYKSENNDENQEGKSTSNDKKNKIKGRYSKPVPVFTQRSDENDTQFMKRVNRTVQEYLKENEFEQKYGVDVIRNADTGEVESVVKKQKDEIDELMKKAQKEARNPKKKKKKVDNDKPRLTKREKRKQRLLLKKQEKIKQVDDGFNRFRDDVKFGETVHEPPNLVKPRRAAEEGTRRPGQNDLLLKNMLNNNQSAPVVKSNPSQKSQDENKLKKIKKTKGAIDKTVKRKNLPIATRRQLETQRDEVVKAYKQMKAERNKSSS